MANYADHSTLHRWAHFRYANRRTPKRCPVMDCSNCLMYWCWDRVACSATQRTRRAHGSHWGTSHGGLAVAVTMTADGTVQCPTSERFGMTFLRRDKWLRNAIVTSLLHYFTLCWDDLLMNALFLSFHFPIRIVLTLICSTFIVNQSIVCCQIIRQGIFL